MRRKRRRLRGLFLAQNNHHAPHNSAPNSISSGAFGAFSPGHDCRVGVSDAHRQNADLPVPEAFASALLDQQNSSHEIFMIPRRNVDATPNVAQQHGQISPSVRLGFLFGGNTSSPDR